MAIFFRDNKPRARKHKINYYNVRDGAWRFLLDNNITNYPLDMHKIIQQNEWEYLTYSEFAKIFHMSINDISENFGENGFVFIADKVIIAINEDKGIKQRFTLAHEIGHIVLDPKLIDSKDLETEVDMFASRVLMPMCLIKELNVTTPEELSKICDVSLESATIRLKRYEEIKGRQKFYTNALEKQVYENLKPFIENYKGNK